MKPRALLAFLLLAFFLTLSASTWARPLHHPSRASASRPSSVLVSARATPLREAEILAILAATNPRAPQNQILMLWAIVALENGRGRYVSNNNLGNVGPVSRRAPRFRLRDGGYYEAFPSVDASARRLWSVLRRCSAAMANADAGDGLGVARSLRRCGYHRTDPSRYGAALVSLYREALRRWPVVSTATRVRSRHQRIHLYARFGGEHQ